MPLSPNLVSLPITLPHAPPPRSHPPTPPPTFPQSISSSSFEVSNLDSGPLTMFGRPHHEPNCYFQPFTSMRPCVRLMFSMFFMKRPPILPSIEYQSVLLKQSSRRRESIVLSLNFGNGCSSVHETGVHRAAKKLCGGGGAARMSEG
ncbi:hypothetical protein HPP92_020577 [Vanilla planifolia]|uniref:Uncharacterized protein n=1 Tax=Vanilla planifolia TaxID=51239 RepID=A0A835Q8S0_VANPL|nr:hypothetical protein HPP92_020577 [Vanilla planifolia]